MRTPLSFTAKGFFILGLALLALPCAAQDAKPAQDEPRRAQAVDANRERIVRALEQGDTVGAEKLFTEFRSSSSAKAATIPQNFSVAYEELKACGFYPQETRLECIVDIKRPGGYGGAPTGRATHEFVTFYVDWNCDKSFSADEAVGLGIVHIHDEVDGAPPVWQYAVYRDIDPPGSLSDKCFMRTGPGGNPVMTKTRTLTINARAILSWFAPVTTPNAVPFWGNTINFRIRLDPIR
jgi:hypothetical protein